MSVDGGKTWNLSEKGLELRHLPDQSIKRFWHIGRVTRMSRALSTPAPTRARCSAFRLSHGRHRESTS
jgi:hypothetical protein